MQRKMSNVTQCVILAAGLGTRLRPHTLTTPKPMLLVAGRPILEWKISQLPPEITEVILVVGYLKEKITDHFGTEWQGKKITYIEQRDMHGTGAALHLCKDILSGKFLVLNGDDLYDEKDIARCIELELAILAKPADVPGWFGAFKIDDDGNLIDIVEGTESPEGALVNTGLYVLDGRFFDYDLVPIKDGKEFGLPQTLVLMAKDHPISIPSATFWFPIGFPEDLQRASVVMKARQIML